MNEGLVFPDTADVLVSLLDGTAHAGETIRAVTWLEADEYGKIRGPFPVVHITALPGAQGYIDRAERATLDVYTSAGELAKHVTTSIVAFIVGSQIDTPAGFVDEINCVLTPADVPYQSDTISKASTQLEVVARPIN